MKITISSEICKTLSYNGSCCYLERNNQQNSILHMNILALQVVLLPLLQSPKYIINFLRTTIVKILKL